jgi:hypothetical protein
MSFPRVSDLATHLGFFFLVLLGVAVPVSIAATNILAGLVLLCFCLSGQYTSRLKSIMQTPYSRMALILFSWLFISGLVGCLLDGVPWSAMFARLAGYKKLFFIAVMIGLLSSRKDEKVQIFCLLAILVGALINLVVDFGMHASGSQWIFSKRGMPGSAIFANTTATGFIMCFLYWGAGVAW